MLSWGFKTDGWLFLYPCNVNYMASQVCHLIIIDISIAVQPLPHPFVFYALWTGGRSLSLGLGQPWLNLDPFPLLALPFGIAFRLQLVLFSYHPILLRLCLFLKLVSFLGADRTKSFSVGPRLLRGAI